MAQAAVAAWSGVANGRIPVSFMQSIGNGQVMEPHAARQLLAAIADMNAHGFSAPIVEGYRDYATQVQLRNLYLSGKGNVAAVPGTSNHGTGSAVDLGGGLDSWTSSAQAYWQSIEANYGYSSAQGRADGEPWHKVCTVWLDSLSNTISNTTLEDIMALKDTISIFHSTRGYFAAGPGMYYPIGDSDGVGGSEKLSTLTGIGIPVQEVSERQWDVLNIVWRGSGFTQETAAAVKTVK